MPGLLRGIARTAIVAGTATSVSNRVSRRQAGRWAQQDQIRYPPPPAPAENDEAAMRLSQLRDLGDLRNQGILSEEEFIQQKEWILNQ
jgi:hypothetical protein